MTAREISTGGVTGYRFVLSRERGTGRMATLNQLDITSRVVNVGPLREQLEELPGIGAVPSLALECVPDDRLAADGPFFANRASGYVVRLEVLADYAAGASTRIFEGVLAADPVFTEDVETDTIRFEFAGVLTAVWGDGDVRLDQGRIVGAWNHITDTILPALVAAAARPPQGLNAAAPRLRADRAFWSYFGAPPADPTDNTDGLPKGLAWDSKKRVLYVGVGRFIRRFNPSTRRWDSLAALRFTGQSVEGRAVRWRVAHLEYDAFTDRLLGVAEAAQDDIRKRASHLKATFVLAFETF